MTLTLIKTGINYEKYLEVVNKFTFPIDNHKGIIEFINELVNEVGENLNIDTFDGLKFDSMTKCETSTVPRDMIIYGNKVNTYNYELHFQFLSIDSIDVDGYRFLVISAGGLNNVNEEDSNIIYVPCNEYIIINPTTRNVYDIIKKKIENL